MPAPICLLSHVQIWQHCIQKRWPSTCTRQSNVALMPTESRAFLKHVSSPQIQITLLTYRFKLHFGKQMEPTLYVRFSDVFQNCFTHSHQMLVCSFHLISSIFTSHCSNLHFHMHQKISSAKMASFRLASRSSRCVACRACYARSYKKVPKPPGSERNGGFTHNFNHGFNQPPPNKGLLRLTKGLWTTNNH